MYRELQSNERHDAANQVPIQQNVNTVTLKTRKIKGNMYTHLQSLLPPLASPAPSHYCRHHHNTPAAPHHHDPVLNTAPQSASCRNSPSRRLSRTTIVLSPLPLVLPSPAPYSLCPHLRCDQASPRYRRASHSRDGTTCMEGRRLWPLRQHAPRSTELGGRGERGLCSHYSPHCLLPPSFLILQLLPPPKPLSSRHAWLPPRCSASPGHVVLSGIKRRRP